MMCEGGGWPNLKDFSHVNNKKIKNRQENPCIYLLYIYMYLITTVGGVHVMDGRISGKFQNILFAPFQ